MPQISRERRLKLKQTNKSFPDHLIEVDISDEEKTKRPNLMRVLRSRYFLAQIFEDGDAIRMSVNKTDVNHDGKCKENISWEDLQQLKRQAGFAHHYAIEVYPRDIDIVNVANMRHLFILEKPLPIGWTKNVEQILKG